MTMDTGVPSQMRVFELAKRLDVPAGELLSQVKELDIEAPNVLKAIDRSQIKRILEELRTRPGNGSSHPDPVLVEELLRDIEASTVATQQAVSNGAGTREDTFPERDVAKPARWRILLVGVVILLATTLLAVLYAYLRPTYAAESDLAISISGLGSEEIERELRSFGVVAASLPVLGPVADEHGISLPDLRDSFSSSIVGDSTVLRFTVTADDPDTALVLNEAIVASYLEVASQNVDQAELEFVRSQMSDIESAIEETNTRLAGLLSDEAANASERLQIETERAVAISRLADLQARLVDLRTSGDAPSGSTTFVEGQINETEARLADLVAEAQALASEDAVTTGTADRLRDERDVLREELSDLEGLEVDLELGQIASNRVSVLAPGHAVDDPVGLTPTRAVALGLLVGGALAFAWVVGATQFRRRR